MINEDEFVAAYIECALWSTTAGGTVDDDGTFVPDETGTQDASFTDLNYEASSLHPDTEAQMRDDCRDFIAANEADLALAEAASTHPVGGWSYSEQAGHDFWLTRVGHGAGFWDRGLGDVGDRLTAASKPYGDFNLYVGDDGDIYGD